MFKNTLKLILITHLLMAFQCNEDDDNIKFNEYKTQVTPQSTFSLNDTIWVNGKVSCKAFSSSKNDSILITDYNYVQYTHFYKFVTPTLEVNCIEALNKFEIIYDKSEPRTLEDYYCEGSTLCFNTILASDSTSYSYRIGFKPKKVGDYVISFDNTILENTNKTENILDNYEMGFRPNQIGFNRCNYTHWKFIDESKSEFFFSVID